jgi:branched-chain amino acid transport system permease protein
MKRPSALVWRAVMAVLLAGVIWFGFTGDLGLINTMGTVFMTIIIAQGWNLLGGYGGYLNLGMAVFFGLGAYTSGILSPNLPFWILVPAGGVVAALGALIIGLPSLRLRGAYFTILTLIIGFLVTTLAFNLDFTRGAMGLFVTTPSLSGDATERLFYFTFLAFAVASIVAMYFVERSRFGAALVAIREDEDASAALGIRTTRVKLLAFLIGAGVAGIAGAIFSYRIGYIEPSSIFSLTLSINVVLMTIVGGAGSWQGPLIGVPLILLLAEFLRVVVTRLEVFGTGVPNELNRVVFGLILVVVALVAKQGVVGIFRRPVGAEMNPEGDVTGVAQA